jgi:hypothetical protein
MTDMIVFAIAGWAFHAILAGLFVGLLAWIGRHRIQLAPWEGLVLFIPYVVWLGTSVASDLYPKGPTNLLLEPVLISGCIGLLGLFRLGLANRGRQERLAFVLFTLTVAFAAGAAVWVPPFER